MRTSTLKVNVNSSLRLRERRVMTAYRGNRRTAPRFLNLGCRWRRVDKCMAYALVTRATALDGPAESQKTQIYARCRESKPDSSVVQPVTLAP